MNNYKKSNFFFLWFSTLITSLSISQILFILTWFIVNELHNESALGLVLAAATIPRILFMIYGGIVADRFSNRLIMFLSDLCKGILIILLSTLFTLNLISIPTLTIFALFYGIADALFWPSNSALIPKIFSEEHLTRVNSIIQTTIQISMLSGSILAGFLINSIDYSITFFSIGLTLITSSFLIFCVKDPEEFKNKELKQEANSNSVKEIVKYVRTSKFPLFSVVLSLGIFNLLATGTIELGIPLIVSNVIDGKVLDYSLFEFTFASGSVIGAILLGFFNPIIKNQYSILSSMLLTGMALLSMTFLNSKIPLLALLLMIGVGFSSVNIFINSAVQQNISKNFIGRVSGFLGVFTTGAIPVSYLFSSLMLAKFKILEIIFIFNGILCIFVGAVFIWSLIQKKRDKYHVYEKDDASKFV